MRDLRGFYIYRHSNFCCRVRRFFAFADRWLEITYDDDKNANLSDTDRLFVILKWLRISRRQRGVFAIILLLLYHTLLLYFTLCVAVGVWREQIAWYIVVCWLGIIVLRIIGNGIWYLVKQIFTDNALKVIIKISGIIFGLFVLALVILVGMQLYGIIGGSSVDTSNIFQGSFFKLDYVFENNPIKGIWL